MLSPRISIFMRKLFSSVILSIAAIIPAKAQDLKVNDLINFCGKKNIEAVNQQLSNRKWSYYNSEVEDNEQSVTWSYGKEEYNDAAAGWLTVYLHEGTVTAITYMFFNEKSYNIFYKSIASNAFSSSGTRVLDEKIEMNFKNNKYLLQISQAKNGYSTSYVCFITPKGSVYDKENGLKREEHYNGGYVEYSLKNGLKEGVEKEYYSNGKVESIGLYKNGKKEGLFKRFNYDGKVVEEELYNNGTRLSFVRYGQGLDTTKWVKIFEETLDEKGNGFSRSCLNADHTQATRNQEYIEYQNHNKVYMEESILRSDGQWQKVSYDSLFYNDPSIPYQKEPDREVLMLMNVGELTVFNENGFELVMDLNKTGNANICFCEKRNGIYNGPFSCFIDTSLYRKVYMDNEEINISDSYPNTLDTFKLQKFRSGTFRNNLCHGVWRDYHISTGKLSRESFFVNGDPEGVTKLYTDEGKLRAELEFKNGMLNGTLKTHYIYDEESDVWSPMEIRCNYKDDKKDGDYYQHNPESGLEIKGEYAQGQKNGLWTVKYSNALIKANWRNGKLYGSTSVFDSIGKPIYVANYTNDYLQGKTLLYNPLGEVSFEIHYNNNKVHQVIDFRNSRYSVNYKLLSDGNLSLVYSSADTTITVNYYSEERLFTKIPANDYDMANYINSLWGTNSPLRLSGIFKCSSSTNARILYVQGAIKDGKKTGIWKYYFHDQGVCLGIDYDSVEAESYTTLEGEQFSGEFRYEPIGKSYYEVRHIKNGECNSKKTKRYSKENNKKYKGDVAPIDYLPISYSNERYVIYGLPDMSQWAVETIENNNRFIPYSTDGTFREYGIAYLGNFEENIEVSQEHEEQAFLDSQEEERQQNRYLLLKQKSQEIEKQYASFYAEFEKEISESEAILERDPSFPGGLENLSKYIADNIKYPPLAKEYGITGKVYVSFIIEKDGTISNVKCIRDIGAGCCDEAILLVESMPKWNPGIQKGKPVRTQFNLPITFDLQ